VGDQHPAVHMRRARKVRDLTTDEREGWMMAYTVAGIVGLWFWVWMNF